MKYELPIYNITIDGNEELGIDEIALVESPAIQALWVAMSEEEVIKLAVNEDKQILTGPALIPDKLIYRIHPKTKEEYYIKFSADVIRQIATRFFKQQKTVNFLNIEHNQNNDVQGTILEAWLVEDTKADKSSLYGFEMPVGTWMLSVHIEDTQFWNEFVRTEKVKGFSIEGKLGMDLEQLSKQQVELVEPQPNEHHDEYIQRCMIYHIDNENMDGSQAYAICQTKWDEHLPKQELSVGEKIGYDFDGTISTRIGQAMAAKDIKSGSTVYIISARSTASGMYAIADKLGIPHDRVFAMGGNLAKAEKVKELGLDTFYDNNRNVRRLLPKGIGVNFTLSQQEAEILIKEILKQNG